jgi:hypothetical protein
VKLMVMVNLRQSTGRNAVTGMSIEGIGGD